MVKNRLPRIVKILAATWSGAEDDFLRIEGGLTRAEKFVHFWALVGRSFVRNRCLVRASALSYASLLALIPLLAVVISVTSSLLKSEGEERIYQAIDNFVNSVVPPASDTNAAATSLNLNPESPAATSPTNQLALVTSTNGVAGPTGQTNAPATTGGDARIATAQMEAARYIHSFVQNTRSGTLGVTGMIVLVFIAISMLSRVEATFNDIWGVTRGRSWVWQILLYWGTITLGPMLLITALGLASGPHFQSVKNLIGHTPLIGGLLFDLLPLMVLWLAFALIYELMPNTRVEFSAALVGGVVAGTLWHLNNLFGFLYVSRVVTNSKIYGSLGLVPVFMAGLYCSWLFLLFGAQVAYAFQNRKVYLQDKLVENVNQRGREFIALRLLTGIGRRFQQGRPPATVPEICAALNLPDRLVRQVLQTLMANRLVVETQMAGGEPAYFPARPLEAINAHDVLLAMRAGFGQEFFAGHEPARAEVYGEFARIEEAERQAAAAVTMLALVNRSPARPAIAAPRTPVEKPLSWPVESDFESASGEASVPPPPAGFSSLSSSPEATAHSAPPPPTEARPAQGPKVVTPEENPEFPL